jgi:hypothetical protein
MRQVLYRLTHPNIVRLVDVAVGSKVESVFLVFEFVGAACNRTSTSAHSPLQVLLARPERPDGAGGTAVQRG